MVPHNRLDAREATAQGHATAGSTVDELLPRLLLEQIPPFGSAFDPARVFLPLHGTRIGRTSPKTFNLGYANLPP